MLLDNKHFDASSALGYVIFGFSPNFTRFHLYLYLHSPHVLLSRLISPHNGSPQCGHFASASSNLYSVSDAFFGVEDRHIVKLANEHQPSDKEQPDDPRMHCGHMCIVCSLTYMVLLLRFNGRNDFPLSLVTFAGVLTPPPPI